MGALQTSHSMLLIFIGLSVISRTQGDFCAVNVCQNGGTCLTEIDNLPFFCLCPEGFTGIACNETEKGPCYPNPCKNEGACEVKTSSRRGDVFLEYYCKCPSGFDGLHCENNVDDCAINPCQNGGQCRDLDTDYVCKCFSPYVGKNCHVMCASNLGMIGGAIEDSQIVSSSIHFGFLGLQRWGPELARLQNKGIVNAWTSANNDKSPWIEVDLQRKMRVTGIMTQGASRAGSPEYVKSFKVAYSIDRKMFTFIRNAREKIFTGNTDNDSIKRNILEPPIIAQYVRIYPVVCNKACTMRLELAGCEMHVYFNMTGCSEELGMKSRLISNEQITASTVFKTWDIDFFTWHPYYARLDKQGKSNAWTAQCNDRSQWIQVDLLTPKKITGIITQGAKDFGCIQYVSSFKVAYSDDGQNWTIYKDNNTRTDKIFEGNKDNNTHKKNVFDPPFYARFLRVLPWTWQNRITLRMELLGCDE
ncbi:lactadherin isoform X1 [Protopterus annectens]|uniref:lactadherin isoform X1 n=1 Tax=Protopterus annectens TaxID=7888 RepID=UPI001CF9EFF4|nr:lactadherin isoform X1 [Protopterus annectens]